LFLWYFWQLYAQSIPCMRTSLHIPHDIVLAVSLAMIYGPVCAKPYKERLVCGLTRHQSSFQDDIKEHNHREGDRVTKHLETFWGPPPSSKSIIFFPFLEIGSKFWKLVDCFLQIFGTPAPLNDAHGAGTDCPTRGSDLANRSAVLAPD
jgi:hypothetical protein